MTHLRQFEFNNRMAAQRKLLQSVNRTADWIEELAGISRDAIDRWARVNSVVAGDDIMRLLLAAAKQLQFLATKSQEQLSENYVELTLDLADIQNALELALANKKLGESCGSRVS